jgi:hypothetical protein
MIIDFNDNYRLETTLTKVESIDNLYYLLLTKIDLVEDTRTYDEHYFTLEQLKEFVVYLNKATNAFI